jgi:SAM-dependent methyltransferase
MIRRLHLACTLAWWLLLYLIPGGMRWRYHRGRWLKGFNAYAGWPVAVPSVAVFETVRHWLTYLHRLVEFPMPTSEAEAVRLWASTATKNLLFSTIGRRELQPLRFLRLMRHLPWRGSVLEYGAGAAPLAHGLAVAWPFMRPNVFVADIEWPLFAYCRKRFAMDPGVACVPAEYAIGTPMTRNLYDAIVCTETLEHVWDGLGTVRRLMESLKPGGLLLYDYGAQSKDQPYAPHGMSQREATLALIEALGQRIYGPDRRGLRVVRKR